MQSGAEVTINSSMHLSHGTLVVEEEYAKSHLSKEALMYGRVENHWVLFDWGTTACVVLFELPRLFSVEADNIWRCLSAHCQKYCEKYGIREDNFEFKLRDNIGRQALD